MIDPYEFLGVSKDASKKEVKKAYRTKRREWHPDRHQDKEHATKQFKFTKEAYEFICSRCQFEADCINPNKTGVFTSVMDDFINWKTGLGM